MKKFTFGVPEKLVPSAFCPTFSYAEKPVVYDASRIRFRRSASGCSLILPLAADEAIYGLGLQLKGFNHRGRKLTLRVNADPVAYTGDSHAPVPFFVSTAGYGIYADTARYAQFHCGFRMRGGAPAAENSGEGPATDTETLYAVRSAPAESVMVIDIPGAEGIDIYIIEGENITDITAQYNMLAGGGCVLSQGGVPDWGLGVFYRCYSKYTGGQVLDLARYFRDRSLPCDIFGLEPGWQSHTYSCSYVWDRERYPDPGRIVSGLRESGFHVSLWEHAFTHPSSPIYSEMAERAGDFEVWGGVVPDFGLPETRRIFADYHRQSVLSPGVDGFKLDECDNSDFTGSWSFPNCAAFPSGLDGEQYHSLFGTLYMQTMLEALGNTGTLGEVRNAGALAAPYPFVLYSDLYEHKDFIRGVVNAGFSGLLWSPEVRHAASKRDMIRRLQTVVFSVQCLVNAWYCEEAPWIKLRCEDEVRELFRLRESLVPRLSESFRRYRETGVPPVRALVSDFTEDRETWGIDDEYMFTENLLVAPMTAEQDERTVYLPAGEWVDFFTRKPAPSGKFIYRGDGIPVYEKTN